MDRLRSEVYEALALGFRRPTAESMGVLSDSGTRAMLADAAERMLVPPPIQWEVLDEFRAWVTTCGPGAAAHELSLEYCRLFLSPGAPCLPYGSLYMDGVVMGPSTLDVVHRYKEEGLRLVEAWKEPPDHIAVELGFMAVLSARLDRETRVGEIAGGMGAQAGFLRTHLARWGPVFAESVARSTSCGLYPFLSSFVAHWIVMDQEFVRASLMETRQETGCP